MDVVLAPALTASPLFPVEPVLQTMRSQLDRPLSLNDLAGVAGLSTFHFHRRFRATIGIPPHEFLTALRLQEAKRLLLTTSRSVTDICYEVGYASLGTFTARFTQLVGTSPGRLRHFADTTALPTVDDLRQLSIGAEPSTATGGTVAGAIHASTPPSGPIFVGLFPKPLPQARPIGSTVLTQPGRYQIIGVPDGLYHLLVAAPPWSADPRVPALPGPDLLVGVGAEPLRLKGGQCHNQTDVTLRSPRPIDPPVLSCLPWLLAQRLSRLTPAPVTN